MFHVTELDPFVCGPATPIREVLARLNELEHPLHVVLDQAGRLLGTVTDGDIRRAFLKGASLDDPISECMHSEAVTGRRGEDESNTAKLTQVEFLPILDVEDAVVEILIRALPHTIIDTCLVMAGGHGSRLGDLTLTTPKPLLPVDGKPILDQIISRLEALAVPEIFISVHYLADQIEAFVGQRDNRGKIRLLHEDRKLGTAGAIGSLPTPIDRPILVINGDVVSHVDFVALRQFHDRHAYDATLAATYHEVQIPFGVIRQSDDGLFLGVDEKPTLRKLVAAGIYYLSPEFCGLVSKDEPMDMPELLNKGRDAGLRVGLFPIHEYWIDVGRPTDLDSVNQVLQSHGSN